MKLKTILIAFLAISMITTVSACDFSDQPSNHWDEDDCIGITYDNGNIRYDIRAQNIDWTEKITNQYDGGCDIIERHDLRLPTQGEIEEIGEEFGKPSRELPTPPEEGKTAKIILEHF